MQKLKEWWNGEAFLEESPYVVFAGVRKPWLRNFYDKHSQKIWGGIGTVALAVILKLVDKII